MTLDRNLLQHSVTAGDYADSPQGGLMHILIGDLTALGSTPGLPPYWCRQRDYALAATLRMCSIWPSAVNKALTKLIAPGFRIEDSQDSTRRTSAGQDLLTYADAADWITFGARHLQDLFLTDNGVFVEVVRSGTKPLGLMHLDSLRCTRTGYPAYPVLYCDDQGREHALKPEEVLFYADMPSPRVQHHGVGTCAADRAFDAIVKLASIETYFREKVTGSRALAIHIVTGVSKEKLKAAMTSADEHQAEKGYFVYKGSVVMPTLDTSATPSVVTIPLAEIPDGFDAAQERDAAYLEIVNALGIALQDIKPLSGQGLGTGTQTVILDEAAEGMGPGAAWRKWFEHAMTFRVLAKTTSFYFATNDIRDQKAKAEVAKLRADTRAVQVKTGEITAAQALNMAADAGDVPKEFLPDDETPGGSLDDNDKPLDLSEAVRQLAAPTAPALPAPLATKAASSPRGLIDEELSAALAVVDEVLSRAPATA